MAPLSAADKQKLLMQQEIAKLSGEATIVVRSPQLTFQVPSRATRPSPEARRNAHILMPEAEPATGVVGGEEAEAGAIVSI